MSIQQTFDTYVPIPESLLISVYLFESSRTIKAVPIFGESMSKSKFKKKSVFSSKRRTDEIETLDSVFSVIEKFGLNVHTWMVAYKEACDKNGGNPPTDFERFLPWNMTPEEIEYFKKPTDVNWSDSSALAYIWSEDKPASSQETKRLVQGIVSLHK